MSRASCYGTRLEACAVSREREVDTINFAKLASQEWRIIPRLVVVLQYVAVAPVRKRDLKIAHFAITENIAFCVEARWGISETTMVRKFNICLDNCGNTPRQGMRVRSSNWDLNNSTVREVSCVT